MTSRPDFADWVSPMLVKELRQGMRSRVFLVSFLALQGAMIFLAILGLVNSSAEENSEGSTYFFWIIIGAPLLLIMPMSGLNSISGERKENTLELIFLSRLSARRIIIGKWLAIVAQTALLVSAILPYAVLRYYLGGVDLVWNLEVLGILLLGSAMLTGLTVALSPTAKGWGRAVIPVVLYFGLQFLGSILGRTIFGSPLPSASGGAGTFWKTLAACLLLGFLFLLSLLEFGAGKIAPPAENYSSTKRIAAFAALLLCSICATLLPGTWWVWFVASLILIPIGIGAICEPVREMASIYRPFVRWGWPGRVFGMLFYPGWPSGVLFSLVTLAILFVVPHGPFSGLFSASAPGISHRPLPLLWPLFGRGVSSSPPMVAICVVGAFYLPAALLHLLRVRRAPPLVFYFIVQAVCALLVVVVSALSDGRGSNGQSVIAMIPFCGLLLSSTMQQWPAHLSLSSFTGAAALTGLSLFVLFVAMIPGWRRIFALEKKAAALAPLKPDVIRFSEPA